MFKLVSKVMAHLLVLPHLLVYVSLAAILGRHRAFINCSESIARIPGVVGVYVRQVFYKRTCAQVGQDVFFGFMSILSNPDVRISDRVFIGRFCSIGWAEIAADTMISDGVSVLSGRHQHGLMPQGAKSLRDNPQSARRVIIGPGAWIGTHAVIMADVDERAIVGAGSVVVDPVVAESKVAGSPARLLTSSPARAA